MSRKTFIDLLTKKISGVLSERDQRKLSIEIDRNIEYQKIFETIHQLNLSRYQPTEILMKQQLDRIWDKTLNTKPPVYGSVKKYFHIPPLGIAASLLIFLATIVLYFGSRKNTDTTVKTTTTTQIIRLQDGSRIRLAKHSFLRYNKDFSKTERQLSFDGTALFDITSNKSMPLYIHTKQIQIKVKGTLFSVDTKNGETIDITLLKGLITILNEKNPNDSVTIFPNQRILIRSESGKLRYQITSATNNKQNDYVSSDTLRFKNLKLETLAKELSRKYNIEIEIKNEVLKEKRFSGIFINESIEQVLENLKISYPIKYRLTPEKVIIE